MYILNPNPQTEHVKNCTLSTLLFSLRMPCSPSPKLGTQVSFWSPSLTTSLSSAPAPPSENKPLLLCLRSQCTYRISHPDVWNRHLIAFPALTSATIQRGQFCFCTKLLKITTSAPLISRRITC